MPSAKRSRSKCPSVPDTEASTDTKCVEGGCCPVVMPESVPPESSSPEKGAPQTLENETEITVEEAKPKKVRKSVKKEESKAPKKAPNAYMLFYRDELKKTAYEGIALPERAKMIGALWRQMDDTARGPFQERAAEAKDALKA